MCHRANYTVDLVIYARLNFREFLILELFTKFIIREFSFFLSSSILIALLKLQLRYFNIFSRDFWFREFVLLPIYSICKVIAADMAGGDSLYLPRDRQTRSLIGYR